MNSIHRSLGKILFGLFLIGCQSSQDQIQGPTETIIEEERIFIIDQTGKEWDITHAAKIYGMKPEKFQYGLGPNWFAPLILPRMISPGEPGYPEDDSYFDGFESDLVLGAEFDGDARAYPLVILYRHEIADEKFGDSYVAVAY